MLRCCGCVSLLERRFCLGSHGRSSVGISELGWRPLCSENRASPAERLMMSLFMFELTGLTGESFRRDKRRRCAVGSVDFLLLHAWSVFLFRWLQWLS